nr:hypothetical protein [Elizabethkingia sp. ASV34]
MAILQKFFTGKKTKNFLTLLYLKHFYKVRKVILGRKYFLAHCLKIHEKVSR